MEQTCAPVSVQACVFGVHDQVENIEDDCAGRHFSVQCLSALIFAGGAVQDSEANSAGIHAVSDSPDQVHEVDAEEQGRALFGLVRLDSGPLTHPFQLSLC